MARNSEKAMAMLNRWTHVKQAVVRGVRGRRPRDSGESENLPDCEYWRNQLVREVMQKIAEIQNAGLGEHKIRDLNDEINRLLREKGRWENRIKELGGPDYKAAAPRVLDAYGAPLTGEGSYKYFGAARDLPGVRELFERDTSASAVQKKTRAQLHRSITPNYYGWRDEEESDLILAEQEREAEQQAAAVAEWQAAHGAEPASIGDSLEDILRVSADVAAVASAAEYAEGVVSLDGPGGDSGDLVAADGFVTLPTTEDIEELLVRQRKEELLQRYIVALEAAADRNEDALPVDAEETEEAPDTAAGDAAADDAAADVPVTAAT